MISVDQYQDQTQVAFTATISIDDLLGWDGLPDELRPILAQMGEAQVAGDKVALLKRSADFADSAAKFPQLINKIGDAVDWVSSLLG